MIYMVPQHTWYRGSGACEILQKQYEVELRTGISHHKTRIRSVDHNDENNEVNLIANRTHHLGSWGLYGEQCMKQEDFAVTDTIIQPGFCDSNDIRKPASAVEAAWSQYF